MHRYNLDKVVLLLVDKERSKIASKEMRVVLNK